MMIRLLDVQQKFSQAQRDAIASALASARPRATTISAHDAAAVEARLRARASMFSYGACADAYHQLFRLLAV